MKKMADRPCKELKPFRLAPEVCDECGWLADGHPRADSPTPLTEAMWRVLFALGGVKSYWGGGLDRHKTDVVFGHVKECRINWKLTDAPAMTTVSEFTDSFHDPDQVEVLAGDLWCACGKVSRVTIAVIDMALGQLMWYAAHIDD